MHTAAPSPAVIAWWMLDFCMNMDGKERMMGTGEISDLCLIFS
jgi:hypothetical protein